MRTAAPTPTPTPAPMATVLLLSLTLPLPLGAAVAEEDCDVRVPSVAAESELVADSVVCVRDSLLVDEDEKLSGTDSQNCPV